MKTERTFEGFVGYWPVVREKNQWSYNGDYHRDDSLSVYADGNMFIVGSAKRAEELVAILNNYIATHDSSSLPEDDE